MLFRPRIIIIILIIIIIIIIIISFMYGIYTYIPETKYFPREYDVSAILLLLFMVLITLVSVLNLLLLLLLLFSNLKFWGNNRAKVNDVSGFEDTS